MTNNTLEERRMGLIAAIASDDAALRSAVANARDVARSQWAQARSALNVGRRVRSQPAPYLVAAFLLGFLVGFRHVPAAQAKHFHRRLQ